IACRSAMTQRYFDRTAAREDSMTGIRRAALIASALTLTLIFPVFAQEAAPDFARLEAAQNADNAKAGPRAVPGRALPVPPTASEELQASIAAPYRVGIWNADPKSPAEWKALISRRADEGAARQKDVREKLGVTLETSTIGGVKVYILTPKE